MLLKNMSSKFRLENISSLKNLLTTEIDISTSWLWFFIVVVILKTFCRTLSLTKYLIVIFRLKLSICRFLYQQYYLKHRICYKTLAVFFLMTLFRIKSPNFVIIKFNKVYFIQQIFLFEIKLIINKFLIIVVK